MTRFRIFLACFFLVICTTFSRAQNVEDAPLSDAAPALDNAATSSTRSSPNAAATHSHDDHDHSGLSPHNHNDATEIATHNAWNIVASFSGDEHAFMRQALFSGVLVALLCSYLGLFVVLRRIVFVGVALAQMSSAGVAFGILFGLAPAWGAALFTFAGVVFFSLRLSPRRVPPDSTIGMAYCLAGALAILLIARSAEGEGDMLGLLQGNILTGTLAETWILALVFAVVAAVLWFARKEFLLISFDRDLAATLGFRAALWDFLLYAILGIVIALSVRAVGVLLTTALLIVPATSALLWSQNWRAVRVLAPLLGVCAVPIGLHLSLILDDFPPSPLVVALLFLPLLLSLLYYRTRQSE